MNYQGGYDQAGERWNGEQAPAVSLRKRAEQSQMDPVDGQAEADHCEAREDSDEDAENEEEYFFVENALKRRKQTAWPPKPRSDSSGSGVAHWLAASRF
jgi:hypothetical protein